MKKITDIPTYDFKGKVAMVRVDYNVPILDGKVIDDARIRSSFKTIQFLRNQGASIILISHIENKEQASLKPVAENLVALKKEEVIDFEVIFHDQLEVALKQSKESYASIPGVHLFENLRTNSGEKENSIDFAKQLASLADVYINEAFPVCHRSHASVVALPSLLPHMAGFTLIDEIEHIEKGINPTRPFIFILGGAKFETKLPLIEKFMQKADQVIIGGALFNDILKAKGLSVGQSLVGGGDIDISHIVNNPILMMPKDVLVLSKQNQTYTKSITDIAEDESVVDIGTSLINQLEQYIIDSQNKNEEIFVLWNGPMGLYEKGYTACTKGLADLFMKTKVKGLVGGGDTSAALAENSSGSKDMYISTGGGAMIEYLLNETLPGIEALK